MSTTKELRDRARRVVEENERLREENARLRAELEKQKESDRG